MAGDSTLCCRVLTVRAQALLTGSVAGLTAHRSAATGTCCDTDTPASELAAATGDY